MERTDVRCYRVRWETHHAALHERWLVALDGQTAQIIAGLGCQRAKPGESGLEVSRGIHLWPPVIEFQTEPSQLLTDWTAVVMTG